MAISLLSSQKFAPLSGICSRTTPILSHFRTMLLRPSFPKAKPIVEAGATLLLVSVAWASCGTSPQDGTPKWTHWEAPASIRSLDVLDEATVRYAGSEGWVGLTQSAGNHWTHQQWMAPDSSFPSFRSSAFAGDHWFAVSIASPAWIARTGDFDWAVEWVHHDTSSAVFLDAMAWWNRREGLVFGDPVGGCLTLLKTEDGGDTWSRLPCTNLPVHFEGEAGFAASNGNICIHGDTAWVFTGGLRSRCIRSVDRGLRWEAFDTPIRQGEPMAGVFGASFSNAEQGLAIGGHWEHPDDNKGNLIETEDGGVTWSLLAEGSGPGYRSCIVHHPLRSNEVVATGFKGVDISIDGGETWRHVSDSARYVARFSPSGRTLWLAGNRTLTRVDWPISDSRTP